MNTTTLILARHGETDWNREGRYQGRRDIALNSAGREQAAMLAQSLGGVRLSAVYASPLSRARETAAAAAGNLPVNIVPELAEINHGEWEGLLATEVAQRWPGVFQAWREAPHTARMPGGETLGEVEERASEAVSALVSAHPGATVLACAHDAVNRALLCVWLGMPLSAFWRLRQDAACVNVVQFTREAGGAWRPRVCLVNSLAHFGKLWSDHDHAAR